MPFAAGQSGNPGGRPRGESKVRAAAREHTDTAIKVLVSALSDPDARIAMKAAEVLLDRGWGKAVQPLAGDDEMPPISHSLKVELVGVVDKVPVTSE